MEDIVAVEVELEDGQRRYFLAWGRIQAAVDPALLEQIILEQSRRFSLGGTAVAAQLCKSLQDAAREPYFYECFFKMCQQKIPYGEHYGEWKKEIDEQMRNGKELYFLGRYN